MLYGIEGILNGKLFGNGEGGSGGVTLPTLANPAGADQILEGYEAVDGSGNKLTGTHVCESGGGGVGVAPMIDHGFGYATFQFGAAQTIPAGGSLAAVIAGDYNARNLTAGQNGTLYGYFYGHPEITAKVTLGTKSRFNYIWNSSATDFVFDQTWTDYVFVPLYQVT